MGTERSKIVLAAILVLIGMQQLYMLVEAIYMLNLLHTSLDYRALGVLFLYTGILLLFFKRPARDKGTRTLLTLFLLLSAISPWVPSPVRILTAGLAVGFFILLLPIYCARILSTTEWFFALILSLMLSVLLRLLGGSQDITLVGPTRFVGIFITACALVLIFQTAPENSESRAERETASVSSIWAAGIGLMSSLFFLYTCLFTPAVLARWSGADYRLVHVVPAFAMVGALLLAERVETARIKKGWHLGGNLLFLLFVMIAIFRNRITFPAHADAAPVIVAGEDSISIVAVVFMLMLSPVVVLNMAQFVAALPANETKKTGLPLFFGGLLLSLLIFMLIFTNVWGYIGGLSLIFRNMFYLPFLIAGIVMSLSAWLLKSDWRQRIVPRPLHLVAGVLGAVIIVIVVLNQPRPGAVPAQIDQLTVMTYNIQQGVDWRGKKNYHKQLEVIKRVDPDILFLQESDVARISGGGSDVVRYFAEHLDYFSCYGPKTVTGTFGTAILSRFPLHNPEAIFTYSDTDEIGTTGAEVAVNGQKILILCNHPAGGNSAHQAHLDMLLHKIRGRDYVIAAGDFNFRPQSVTYAEITRELVDSWLAAWPDGVGDMSRVGIFKSQIVAGPSSGKWLDETHLTLPERIDHIFVSPDFEVLMSAFLPAPESESDHPAHWTVLRFRRPGEGIGSGSDLMPISKKR